MDFAERLPLLLLAAWLTPLAAFVLVVFFGKRMGNAGVGGAYVATAAIAISCGLSLIALFGWVNHHGLPAPLSHHHHEAHHHDHDDHDHSDHEHGDHEHGDDEHHDPAEAAVSGHDAQPDDGQTSATAGFEDAAYHGQWYTLAEFGSLKLTIGYYIDALTVVMFSMVTIIATCIHFYAMGYMHEELHEVKDKEVELTTGEHLLRPGRYYRFFQYLSLFCFSMLGIVVSGNLAMTFVFWELVGICSYFLIGFYIERKSASTAANKAFIVNRVGDFGFIIGLMVVFSTIGTFDFGGDQGIFAAVRPGEEHPLTVPDSMVQASAVMHGEAAATDDLTAEQLETFRGQGFGYGLLITLGLGVFCGCVGKSAQFPLHTWLPDAMEGPTPVSALVHSATMVAAGVFLVGRFYPVFAPEVLLTIAVIGCFTLFMAATIAITATDIKRVLAYSTLSQLGYMMFALGVGGWLAGMLHLITHAFFKSLLFMCSGSVIHAVHSNEMTEMGGLRKKMPVTAYTMLVGCLAIMGAGIPFLVGFSGYYSKDSIIAQALSFKQTNPGWGVMYFFAVGGAAITAFYMFRLWYMTFAGEPRNHHRYDHAHESPRVMWVPLVVLAVFATFAVFPSFNHSGLVRLLSHAEPQGIHAGHVGRLAEVTIPPEMDSHADAIHVEATMTAFTTAMLGFLLATIIYGLRKVNPDEVRQKFSPIYGFLRHKWYFDELYHVLFVVPVKMIGVGVSWFDRTVIDGVIHFLARLMLWTSSIDEFIDRRFVDGFVNGFAKATYSVGLWLRGVQTGSVRQYVVYIVVGTILLFVLASFFLNYSLALDVN